MPMYRDEDAAIDAAAERFEAQTLTWVCDACGLEGRVTSPYATVTGPADRLEALEAAEVETCPDAEVLLGRWGFVFAFPCPGCGTDLEVTE